MSYPDYGSPDQPSGYPQREPYYPPVQPPQPGGYPPQGGYPPPPPQHGGYPPQGNYPPDQTWSGYPQRSYPPQHGGYPQEPTWGYPAQPGYPPQQGGYAQPGYPPQQAGYPQQSVYTPQDTRQGGYIEQEPVQTGQYGQRTTGRRYEPPKKSRKGLWIFLTLVLVICGGGGVATYVFFGDRFTDQELPSAAPKTVVMEPATLGGRPQNTTPELAKAADETRASFKKEMPKATGSASAYYGTREKKNLVAVLAMAVPELDEAMAQKEITDGLTKELGTVNLAAVEPGPLGGAAKCTDGKAGTVPVAACFWTDPASFGMIMYFDKTVAEIKAEFVANRNQIEKKL